MPAHSHTFVSDRWWTESSIEYHHSVKQQLKPSTSPSVTQRRMLRPYIRACATTSSKPRRRTDNSYCQGFYAARTGVVCICDSVESEQRLQSTSSSPGRPGEIPLLFHSASDPTPCFILTSTSSETLILASFMFHFGNIFMTRSW